VKKNCQQVLEKYSGELACVSNNSVLDVCDDGGHSLYTGIFKGVLTTAVYGQCGVKLNERKKSEEL